MRLALSPVAALTLTLLTLSSVANAAPQDPRDYDVSYGGLVNIKAGAYVEGSHRLGGIQPDYFIDLEAEPLKSVMLQAEKIGRSDLSYWDKVGTVVELIQEDVFRYTDYSNPYYRRLLKRYRIKNEDIPLHEYFVCKAGVCREHALALHFALKAAGIANLHAYANIYRASRFDNFEVIEDHAFTVVRHGGTDWVVDAYYWGFNGFKLKDLLSAEGITKDSIHAPIADPGPGTRRIIQINHFPKIYNPKNTRLCRALFDSPRNYP